MSILDLYKPRPESIRALAFTEADPKYAAKFSPIARGKIIGLTIVTVLLLFGGFWFLVGWTGRLFKKRDRHAPV